MQNNVLKKTLNKKQAPIFNLKWVYAAAAVILLIVMANFLINTNVKKGNLENSQLTAKTELAPVSNRAQTFVGNGNDVAQNSTDLQNSDVEDTADLSTQAFSNLSIKRQIESNGSIANSVKIIGNTSASEQIDSVLDGFSSSEIASLSNSAEQDVYLDLYN